MKKLLLTLILLLFASSANAENSIEIRIPCKINEQVTAILPNHEIINLGKIIMTPSKTNYPAYTASKWSTPSTVCASAVNAVHILINTENDRGRIISLVPSITIAPAAQQGAFFAIDSPAGTGIFGGFAPLTGSKVSVIHDGIENPLIDIPNENDILLIKTPLPENPNIYMIDIENRPGGRVIAYGKENIKIIARVIHRVSGVGRFGGTNFQDVGRIRASHSGVIDISTSKRGEIGGIQIMPLKHALTSHEMASSWNLTQWMIISPLPNNQDLEGNSPLFKNSLLPGPQLNDKLPDIWSQYGRRPLILCRINGGNWEKIPEFAGKIDDALNDITHLRIYFPIWNLID